MSVVERCREACSHGTALRWLPAFPFRVLTAPSPIRFTYSPAAALLFHACLVPFLPMSVP